MNDQIIRDMVKKIDELEREQRRLASLGPLYSILNLNTPAILTANQNDYDPGEYDILQLTSNASRTITGISGGVVGRVLTLVNIGNFSIVLAHASASSLTVNQIYIPGGANITMSTFGGAGTARAVQMYHSGNVWVVTFRSAP